MNIRFGHFDSFKLTESVEEVFKIDMYREAYDKPPEDVSKLL